MVVLSSFLLVGSMAFCGVSAATALLSHRGTNQCRCGPEDDCWPSQSAWADLNRQVNGRLVKTQPIALPCYPGPAEDRGTCKSIVSQWTEQEFQTTHPLGLAYPTNITCPPVDYNNGQSPKSCTLGPNPRYAVNATTTEEIRLTIAFAKEHNIRLVTKSTGHDINGRSDGFGSLELWLRYHRNGIEFQDTFSSRSGCENSAWSGHAIKIGGAYQWRDVHAVAKEHGVIIVGGGSASVGAVGGWATGGGHGPATRNYGMGADQILEVEAMLADGHVVIANACQNSDLYKAFRGGGPGYAVALSFTMKAHPNVNTIAVQRLEIAPIGGNASALLDAVAVMFQSYPTMNDAGFAGYGYWYLNSLAPIFGNTSIGYYHDFWNIGKNVRQAKEAFEPMRNILNTLDDIVTVSETYNEYSDYWSMYDAKSGLNDPVGSEASLTSRLFDSKAVSGFGPVRNYVKIASGNVNDFTTNVVSLVSGGQVAEDAKDPHTGLHPAWRTSPFLHLVGWGWAPGSDEATKAYVRSNITNVKGAAQKGIAPNTGGYMNEGDRLDPEWKDTFFGPMYTGHLATKRKYDPDNIFFCPICVGSDEWIDMPERPLCRVS